MYQIVLGGILHLSHYIPVKRRANFYSISANYYIAMKSYGSLVRLSEFGSGSKKSYFFKKLYFDTTNRVCWMFVQNRKFKKNENGLCQILRKLNITATSTIL